MQPSIGRLVGIAFLALIVLYALGFLATGGDLAIYRFWAPKQAAAENQVFHQTQQFTDGKNVTIVRECAEMRQAEGPANAAFASEIRTEAVNVDPKALGPDATSCLNEAKGY